LHKQSSYKFLFLFLILILIAVGLINIRLGSVDIPLKQIFYSLINHHTAKESWQYIIVNYRLPKAITATLVGSGLAISGLLMQTLFRNPLAGPFVLGISSGASLGVALLILGSTFMGISFYTTSNFSVSIAASLGAFIVLGGVLIAANKVRNTMSILIIGLMFSSITSAIINVLANFSQAEKLQQFLIWNFGSLGNLSWNEILLFSGVYSVSILLVLFVIKPLNSLLLGENYAKSLGISFKKTRLIILIATSLLTGVITAFSGPIAFIGLAVPHITKLLFNTSDHKILLPAVALNGAILMLICDTIAQLPNSQYTLPINAITSLFGAPVVIWLLMRKRTLAY